MIYLKSLHSLVLGVMSLAAAMTASAAEEAKVIGPQSTVEQYDAPFVEPDLDQNFIDFPALINAPTAEDGRMVIPEVIGISVEFVQTDATERTGEFVNFSGRSKAEQEAPQLLAAIAEALAIHRFQPLKLGDLRLIQQDVTEAYRAQGYPLMSVVIPPQEVTDGRFKIQVNEFQLSAVSVVFAEGEGAFAADARHWSNRDQILASMKKIKNDPILSQKALDREVTYLNQNPFRQVRVVFEPGEEVGQSAAVLQVSEEKPWNLTSSYNNHASESSGTNRYVIGGSFANLPIESHQVSFNITTGDDFDEFANYTLSYRIPNRFGHTLSLSANYSDTASSNIPGITSASTTTQYTANYAVPLLKGEKWSWTADSSAVLKQFERASLFDQATVGGAEFDSVQLLINSSFNWQEDSATNQITANLVFSLEGITGSNSDDNFRSFHNSVGGEASTEHLVLGYARVQQLAPFGEFWQNWSTETQVSWQLAHQELAGSDNFSIGGANVFKAYQSSAVAGDEGWYLTQTLNMPGWQADQLGVAGRVVKSLALKAYVEVGEGSFQDGGDDSLWDLGLGLNSNFVGNVGCNLSLAFAGKETARTNRGDTQVFVGCSYKY